MFNSIREANAHRDMVAARELHTELTGLLNNNQVRTAKMWQIIRTQMFDARNDVRDAIAVIRAERVHAGL